MTFEVLQNPYFVMLYCIGKTHFKDCKNRPSFCIFFKRRGGGTGMWKEDGEKNGNQKMLRWLLKHSKSVFCNAILYMNIDKHISTYNIVKNKSFDNINILWALKFKKEGGPRWKKRGGRPPVPPPPKSALGKTRVSSLLKSDVQALCHDS